VLKTLKLLTPGGLPHCPQPFPATAHSTTVRAVCGRVGFVPMVGAGLMGGLPAAQRLMTDLGERLASRPQIITDGLRSYIWGVERAFGMDVDYGMLIKSYAEEDGRLVLTGA